MAELLHCRLNHKPIHKGRNSNSVTHAKYNEKGELHCVDAPAFKNSSCTVWYLYGKLHCLIGPAAVYFNPGSVSHRIDGRFVEPEDFEDAVIDYCNKNPECPSVVHLMQNDTPQHVLDYCAAHPESAAASAYRQNNDDDKVKVVARTAV